MAGKRQKSPAALQGHRSVAPLKELSGGAAVPREQLPAPPEGLDPAAVDYWYGYLGSVVGRSVVNLDTDGPALRRWAACVSQRLKLQPQLDATPLVKGSMGQKVVNPINTLIVNLTREIERLEEHFGMTPLARMRLGIAIGEAADSLAGLTDTLFGDGGAPPDGISDYLDADYTEAAWTEAAVADGAPGVDAPD